MDHIEIKRKKILVALALYWCLHMIVQHVLDMQALALNGEWENAMVLSICFEGIKMSDRSVWAFECSLGFTDRLLLGYFTEKMVQTKNSCMSQHIQVSLWEVTSVFVEKEYTYERVNFTWEIIVMSLQRLGIRNILCTVGDVYGIWSMHDWTLFQSTKVERNCIKGKFLPYKMIGDCVNPVRPWIYNLFEGCA